MTRNEIEFLTFVGVAAAAGALAYRKFNSMSHEEQESINSKFLGIGHHLNDVTSKMKHSLVERIPENSSI